MNRLVELQDRVCYLFGFTPEQFNELLEIAQKREFSVGDLAERYHTTVHVINHVLKEIDHAHVRWPFEV